MLFCGYVLKLVDIICDVLNVCMVIVGLNDLLKFGIIIDCVLNRFVGCVDKNFVDMNFVDNGGFIFF